MSVAFQAIETVGTPANSTTLAVNVPAGTQDGDLLLTRIAVFSNRTITPPAGGAWTLIREDADATVFTKVQSYYRVASSEPASYTWTQDLDRPMWLSCVRVTGQHPSSPINAHGGQADTVGSTSCTAPSITTTV